MVYVKNNVSLSAMREFKFIALGIQFQIKIIDATGPILIIIGSRPLETSYYMAISLTIEAN